MPPIKLNYELTEVIKVNEVIKHIIYCFNIKGNMKKCLLGEHFKLQMKNDPD